MDDLPPEPAASPVRDRRRLLRNAFAWLPTGLWTGALLVGLRAALELAARHRSVGTASAEEAAIFLWETMLALPALAWGAALAGPLVAALAFRFGRTPASRAVVTALGAGLATAGLAADAWSRGQLVWRSELALDAPLVFCPVALLLVVFTVRVVDVGARFDGPLEDAPALLRPLLGGGATAGGCLALGLALALPPGVATPPQREVLLPLRDLLLEPGAAPDTMGLTPLTPLSDAYGSAETRPALRLGLPDTYRFGVVEGATHLVAGLAVDREAGQAIDTTLTLRCDVLLDGVVATREEVRIAPLGELVADGLGPGAWRALGGPDGVPLAGVEEVELRLELVGPRDGEGAASMPSAWVGFAPLVQVERRSARFAAPTRARPNLVVVRLPRGIEPPAPAWTIDLEGAGFLPELPALATELNRTGTATAALGPRPAGRIEGFEALLPDPAALDRWLESHAGARSFLCLDLSEPTVATGGGGARGLLEEVQTRFPAGGATIWAFLDGTGSTARVSDFRHATGLDDAVLSPSELREALAARASGRAPSVAAAWEGRGR